MFRFRFGNETCDFFVFDPENNDCYIGNTEEAQGGSEKAKKVALGSKIRHYKGDKKCAVTFGPPL